MKRTVNLREMSAAGTSLTSPSINQESQTQKVIMDLQQEKKRLRLLQGNSTSVGILSLKPQVNTLLHSKMPASDSSQQLLINQRSALQMAHNSSFGYFITQASAFGNTILPVIPRVDANK